MAPAPLIEAEGLCLGVAGRPLRSDLSFAIGPGLHFVQGGQGRGKTCLLNLLAGRLQPQKGTLRRSAASIFFEDPREVADDNVVARAWLESRRRRFPEWDRGHESEGIDGFGLRDHIHKPMYMLSTGSRRKVGLVAALASGADITLLDTPFAALDAVSCRRLADRLAQAAEDRRRAWVLADYELPANLASAPLAGLIELGD